MNNYAILVTADTSRAQKDIRQRQIYFVEWLDATQRPWYKPDLNAYREYLFTVRRLGQSSVAAYIGTIKTRYRALVDAPEIHRLLEQEAPDLDQKDAFVAHAMAALVEATGREAGHVPFLRNPQVWHLSTAQINQLLAQPDITTGQGVRDVAIMGLILCTGIHESELCRLTVADLDHEVEGWPAIRVLSEADRKQRHVPIDDDKIFDRTWLSDYLKAFQTITDVKKGPFIRGFYHGGFTTTGKPITVRAMQKTLRSYQIQDQAGKSIIVTGLDLRRTYTRRLYQAGVDIETLRENLGYKGYGSVLEYIDPSNKPNEVSDEGKADGYILRGRLERRNRDW